MADAGLGRTALSETPNADADAERRRLRWRCRRGMRELDQLMERFLDRCWATSSEPERALFRQLLDSEDDILWRWCMGRERPEDADLAGFIDRLLSLPP